MVTALVECHVQLPRAESYLTEQADEYGVSLVQLLPSVGGRDIVRHPRYLQTLLEDSCQSTNAANYLASFADMIRR